MFPSPSEIKMHASVELDHMVRHGYDHGEIDLSFPQYSTKLKVFVRNGALEYAKVLEHPRGILPTIQLKS